MPCDQVRMMDVQFGEQTDHGLFAEALKEMGFNVSVSGNQVTFTRGYQTGYMRDGRLSIPQEMQGQVSTMKREYSKQVVKSAAKRFGWALQQDKQNEYKFIATRRGV